MANHDPEVADEVLPLLAATSDAFVLPEHRAAVADVLLVLARSVTEEVLDEIEHANVIAEKPGEHANVIAEKPGPLHGPGVGPAAG